MDKLVKKAKEIIEKNIYLVLATSSKSGKPWISPVFFAYDSNYNLYFVSNKNSLHAQLIRSNPRVATVIFNSSIPEGEGEGVYFEATAAELTNESEIQTGMDVYDRRATKEDFRVKNISKVTGSGVWRIYKASPTKISVLTEGEFVNGQYVDKRVGIDL